MDKNLPSLLLIGTIALAPATADEPPLRIAPFKDNKTAALSYTFDDGLRDQCEIAAPILEKLQIPATFFIIPGKVAKPSGEQKPGQWGGMTWDEIRSLAARGFEIGNHSLTHPNLAKADDAQLEEQIETSADLLQKETGAFPISFCFPYNSRDERVDRQVYKRHAVARTFQRAFGKKDQNAAGLNQWIDTLITKQEWGVTMIHGLVEGFDSPLDPQMFEQHLAYAKSKEPQLWIDTFGNIGRYIKEAQSTKIRIIQQSANSITFALDSELDPKLFNIPLTVIINGRTLAECMPDGKPVTIKW